MLRKFLMAAVISAAIAAPASAQFAGRFSWGPTMPMFKVSLADSIADGEDRTSFLAAGAGAFFAGNLAPSQDGRWRMVTFALPVFVNYDNGVGFDAGLTVGTLNNLISFGFATPLIRNGDVVDDVFSRETTYLLISASLNFGAGVQGSDEQVRKLAASGNYGRPPGYCLLYTSPSPRD